MADSKISALTDGGAAQAADAVPVSRTTDVATRRVTAQSIADLADKAPKDAQYVTLATNATLTVERVLTAGLGITLTDAGAGSTITVATDIVAFRAKGTADQSISNATDTLVAFDTEDFDTDSLFNPATELFTVPTGYGGKWLLGINIGYVAAATDTGFRRITLMKNPTGTPPTGTLIGRNEFAATNSAGVDTNLTLTVLVTLAQSDTVGVVARQNSGGSLNIHFVADFTPSFWGVFMGP